MRALLDAILGFSLRRRGFVLVASLAMLIWGYFAIEKLPIDVLPDLTKPTVTVLTESHGLTPEEVELQVTRTIERTLLAAPGVTRVRSTSGMGLSAVFVEFDWGSDVYRNRQIVQERLQIARARLPEGALPTLGPIASLIGQIQLLGVLREDGGDPVEMRAWVDRVLRLRLLAIPGVSQVLVQGSARQELLVELDPARMLALGVEIADVADAIRRADHTASGAFLETGSQANLIRVSGRLNDPIPQLGAVELASSQRGASTEVVRLRQVAKITRAPATLRVGDAGVDGQAACLVVIQKQTGQDTVELTRRIEAALATVEVPEAYRIRPNIFRQADFVERAIDNVTEAVRDGAILVLLVLLVFLMNLRTTLITLTAIPLSIAWTAITFSVLGLSINTMTLGGLAVAIGALVDDAIVDVENIYRRLRENRRRDDPRSAMHVVLDASREVRRPILLGTIVVMAVYLPLFALQGMEGRLFTPIGITYVVSILASLLVALTLTPALCLYLLPSMRSLDAGPGVVARRVQDLAERGVRTSIRYTGPILAGILVLAVCASFVLFTRGSEFLPPFNEGSAQVNLFLPPGTSLETSNAFGKRLENVVRGVDGVAAVGRRTGRAEGDEHAMGVETSEMIVSFDPDSTRSREAMLTEIRAKVEEAFPGVDSEVEQPLAHLLSHLLSGVAAQVAIKIRGSDLSTLRRIGEEIHHEIEEIPGVVNANVETQQLVDEYWVRPDRQRLAQHGLSVADLAETVELTLAGERVASWLEGEIAIPIVMRLRAEDRDDARAIERILVSTDPPLRIGDVARVERLAGPNRVERENARRRLVVRHNVEGRSLSETVRDVETVLERTRKDLPDGYQIDLEGQFEAERRASRTLLLLSILAFALMALLIWQHYRSANLTAQVFLNLPTAFIGAVILVVATQQNVSIATLVGLISLGGIAVRNKILLLDHYLMLHRDEGLAFDVELLVRAGRERILPVLMTALTTGVALLPLVIAGHEPGRELLYPVATVIVGGLVTTTILDVLLTPGVFYAFGRVAAESRNSVES